MSPLKRSIFVGTRLESCRAFTGLMMNYGHEVEIVTFEGSFLADKIQEFSAACETSILAHDKVGTIAYFRSLLKDRAYSVFLSAGLPFILPGELLKGKTVFLNAHPHILPGHEGNAAIRKSFEAKEKAYGVTVHYMDEKADAGRVLAQRKVVLEPDDIEDIYSCLFSFLEPAAIVEALSLLKEKNAI